MHAESVRLSTEQAANYLGLSPFTLKAWRRSGTGPRWIKLSTRRVVYDRADLDSFMDACRQGEER